MQREVGKDSRLQFFNATDARVKICVGHTFDKSHDVKSIQIMVAVEEPGADRKGVYFALGDRLHLPLDKFPEYKFHFEVKEQLQGPTSCRTDLMNGDVLAFAKDLCTKL
jgi:hypothetical protein